ncbi:hypothetical protein A2J01_31110 [Rhodococcus sp. EPR-134]|nr:hypothetical protein A2J01_31110 [Rhodococcus sp. EPR-134]
MKSINIFRVCGCVVPASGIKVQRLSPDASHGSHGVSIDLCVRVKRCVGDKRMRVLSKLDRYSTLL